MVDYTTTIHPQLAAHAEAFLRKLPQLTTLPALEILGGAYVANDGKEFDEQGTKLKPAFALKVGSGQGVLSGGKVRFDAVSLSQQPTLVPLSLIEERGDAVSDDKATLERLLSPYGEDGKKWAKAIAEAPDRATRFNRAVREIQGVPANSPSADEIVMVAYLARHFTYDQAGAYYPKWKAPSDTAKRNFPDDLSAAYKKQATLERTLEQDHFYCLSVLCGPKAADGKFLAAETVSRITMAPGSDVADVDVVYSAARLETAEHRQLCFFYAAAGTNIAVAESARGTLTAELAALRLDRTPEQILAELQSDGVSVLDETGTKVKLSAVTRPGATFSSGLPDGVVWISEPAPAADVSQAPAGEGDADDHFADQLQGGVHYFLCPPAKIVELAGNDNILALHRVGRSELCNTDLRSNIKMADYLTHLGSTEGGADVFIGIVDTGLDGQHAAFKGRVHKVWDQTIAKNASFPPPTGAGNDFGQVWTTDADIQAKSTDEVGHGTHVAGIAGGAASGTYTQAGMATKAKFIIVKTDLDDDHIRRGVEWCFREAGTKPCVINLSLGGHSDGHDGVDDLSLAIRRTFRQPLPSGTDYRWVPGRVVCVAAGNEAASRGHTHVESIAPKATADLPVITAGRKDGAGNAIPHNAARITLFARQTTAGAKGARVDVRVRRATGAGPAATKWFSFSPTGAGDSDIIGTTTIGVVNGPPPPDDRMGMIYTRHQRVEVTLLDMAAAGIPDGTWTIEVRNASPGALEVHGYIVACLRARRFHRVFFGNATQRSMVGSPGATFGVVLTGASVNRSSWRPQGAPADGSGDTKNMRVETDPATNLETAKIQEKVGDIAFFSNPGPVRGTSRTIRAMLPGSGVLSARSSAAGFQAADIISGDTVKMSGTSMATPAVTGVVACLLAKHGKLTAKQVIDRLETSVDKPAGWDVDRHGPGRLNASKIAT